MMSDDEKYEFDSDVDKRAYHNLLERQRRDHIKYSFTSLRDSLPTFKGGNVRASRAQILKSAADYIRNTQRKNSSYLENLNDLEKENLTLKDQIQALQQALEKNDMAAAIPILEKYNGHLDSGSGTESESEDSSDIEEKHAPKRIKVEKYTDSEDQ